MQLYTVNIAELKCCTEKMMMEAKRKCWQSAGADGACSSS